MGAFDILSLPVVASCFLHIARDLSPMGKIPPVFQGSGGVRDPFFINKSMISLDFPTRMLFFDDFFTFFNEKSMKKCLSGGVLPLDMLLFIDFLRKSSKIDQNGHSDRVRQSKSSKNGGSGCLGGSK